MMSALSPSLKAIQNQHAERLAVIGIPSKKHPDYRYTSIPEIESFTVSEKTGQKWIWTEDSRTWIAPGSLNASVNPAQLPKGLQLQSWEDALVNQLKFVSHLPETFHEDPVVHQIAAQWTGGWLITIAAQQKVTLGIQPGDAPKQMNRWVFNLLEGAELELVFSNSSLSSPQAPADFYQMSEFYLAPGSRLQLSRSQELSAQSKCFERLYFELDKDTSLRWIDVNIGGQTGQVRGHFDVKGSGVELDYQGCSSLAGSQHLDHWLTARHHQGHSYSNMHLQTVLGDQASTVFNGNIDILKNAPQTQAYQKNKNLLLSSRAVANTIPKLEIATDDVQCAHGATVSDVDLEQIFYLESRGISKKQAMSMVILAALDSVIQKIGDAKIQERLIRSVVRQHGLEVEED